MSPPPVGEEHFGCRGESGGAGGESPLLRKGQYLPYNNSIEFIYIAMFFLMVQKAPKVG